MVLFLKQWYEHKYKVLMIIPIALVIFALMEIGLQYAFTGDFVNKGITLQGGSTITITASSSVSPEELEAYLKNKFPGADMGVRTITAAGKIVSLAVDSDAQESANTGSSECHQRKNTSCSSGL